jgi:hypothetical protein
MSIIDQWGALSMVGLRAAGDGGERKNGSLYVIGGDLRTAA